MSIEFPDINKMVVGSAGKTTNHGLGDVYLRDIRMRNVNISLTVTDPPAMQIEILRKNKRK